MRVADFFPAKGRDGENRSDLVANIASLRQPSRFNSGYPMLRRRMSEGARSACHSWIIGKRGGVTRVCPGHSSRHCPATVGLVKCREQATGAGKSPGKDAALRGSPKPASEPCANRVRKPACARMKTDRGGDRVQSQGAADDTVSSLRMTLPWTSHRRFIVQPSFRGEGARGWILSHADDHRQPDADRAQ